MRAQKENKEKEKENDHDSARSGGLCQKNGKKLSGGVYNGASAIRQDDTCTNRIPPSPAASPYPRCFHSP